jgi:regulatory protein
MSEITAIEVQSKDKTRANVYLDGEFFAGVSIELCVKHGLKKGLDVNENFLQEIIFEDDKGKALSKAVKYMGANLKSCQQIRDYLKKKEYSKEIVDYVNNELLNYQNKGTVIYEKNKCVQKIFSYDDIGFGENKNLYTQKIKDVFGDDFKNKYLIDGDESYVVKFKNLYKDFKKQFNDNRYIIDNIFTEKFSGKLETFGISNPVISIYGIKSLPDWATKLCTHLTYFVENPDNYKDNDNHIQYMMSCQCDIDMSFDETFSSPTVKNNEELLIKFETELDNIRVALYGMENGEICDKYNPSPDSAYGKYLEAKEKLENDEYSQAEKAYGMASSGMSDMQTMLNEYEKNDENGTNDIPQTSTGSDLVPNDSSSTNVVAPQTVFDILGFINGMKKMIMDYPYIIQGITGLDNAYNKHYSIKDPYLGSGDDKITITCLESIDLRVSSMFNRYFNAVYDRQYRRERVPINLRRFNCSVYVHDVRNFNPKRNDGITRISELRDMYFSAIEFRFYDCEIVPEETGNIFNDVSNEAPSEMKKTNFTFTYGNCVVNFLPAN